MKWALVIVVLAACKKPAPVTEDPKPKHTTTTKKKTASPPPTECTADADCVLMPELGCCGECPSPAPYEAVTRAELDAQIIEDDEQCATDDWDCDTFTCSASPVGCKARAACKEGQCIVTSNGC